MNSGMHTIHYTQRQRKRGHTVPRNLMVPDSKGTHCKVALRMHSSGKGYTPELGSTAVTDWQARSGDKSWLVDRILKTSREGEGLKLLHTCWILRD